LLSLTTALGPVAAKGPAPADATTAEATIAAAQLPPQGRDVLVLIQQGGPFRHDKDGTVFGNRERLLPSQARGYYREYTVRTPGVSHRGARRIVCGGKAPSQPDACYYTEDHYASFRRIVQ
jgi:ribonuclease T1